MANNDGSILISVNLNEEEQKEQGKKNQGEEKIAKDNSAYFSLLPDFKKMKSGNFYFLHDTAHTVEILLPPPEYLF